MRKHSLEEFSDGYYVKLDKIRRAGLFSIISENLCGGNSCQKRYTGNELHDSGKA